MKDSKLFLKQWALDEIEFDFLGTKGEYMRDEFQAFINVLMHDLQGGKPEVGPGLTKRIAEILNARIGRMRQTVRLIATNRPDWWPLTVFWLARYDSWMEIEEALSFSPVPE